MRDPSLPDDDRPADAAGDSPAEVAAGVVVTAAPAEVAAASAEVAAAPAEVAAASAVVPARFVEDAERTLPGEEREVGVGPWPGGEAAWPRLPDGSLDPRYDPALLRDGDRRNVVDEFRYWTLDAIVADLDTRRHDLHVAIENWHHDLNIGSVVRTANAFLVKEVHVVGRRRWNRRGAMVTDRYQHVRHHPTVSDLLAWARAEDLPVVGIDNVPGSLPIEMAELPRRCLMLLGQEGAGLTPEALEACTTVLHIAQFGSTRSLNAGAAAAIAMHTWIRQHATLPPTTPSSPAR